MSHCAGSFISVLINILSIHLVEFVFKTRETQHYDTQAQLVLSAQILRDRPAGSQPIGPPSVTPTLQGLRYSSTWQRLNANQVLCLAAETSGPQQESCPHGAPASVLPGWPRNQVRGVEGTGQFCDLYMCRRAWTHTHTCARACNLVDTV